MLSAGASAYQGRDRAGKECDLTVCNSGAVNTEMGTEATGLGGLWTTAFSEGTGENAEGHQYDG